MINSWVKSKQRRRLAWTMECLLYEHMIALGQAIGTSTWKNYGSALNPYLTFIQIHNFPVEPSADSISFFTVFMSFYIKHDSVNSYLSGICQQLEPFLPNIREIRKSILCKHTLSGCKRLRGVPTKRKRALTMHDLQIVIGQLNFP
jgi:hypothetical protein